MRGRTRNRPIWDGPRLARDMASRGWHQAELARVAKVTEATVSRALNGGYVSAPLVKRIARALGEPLDRYLDDIESEQVPEPQGAVISVP